MVDASTQTESEVKDGETQTESIINETSTGDFTEPTEKEKTFAKQSLTKQTAVSVVSTKNKSKYFEVYSSKKDFNGKRIKTEHEASIASFIIDNGSDVTSHTDYDK